MANYYTEFSFTVPCENEQQEEWLLRMAHKSELWSEYGLSSVDLVSRGYHVWFYGYECPDIEALSRMLQRFLLRFRPDKAIAFEWANGCSSPRTDAFGGGAIVITADTVDWFNTGNFIGETVGENGLSLLDNE